MVCVELLLTRIVELTGCVCQLVSRQRQQCLATTLRQSMLRQLFASLGKARTAGYYHFMLCSIRVSTNSLFDSSTNNRA